MKIPKINLNINTDTVCFLIAKAREFHAKESVNFPEKLANTEYEYDWAQILADHQDDATFQEIKSVIEDLEPDQQTDLLTLLYVGRGDFDITEWSLAHKEAKNNLRTQLTEYLLAKPQLSDYLASALDMLGYSCE